MTSANIIAPPPPTTPTSLALPKEVLDNVKPAEEFPSFRLKWLSNEEVVSVLINYNAHSNWMSSEVEQRPPNGTLLLVNRKATKYKKDGYCWKVRKDSRVIREDTIKLKVQAFDIVKCLYAHSSLISTFHRRSYCLFVNPDVVLVHYLNELQEMSPLAMLDSTVSPLTTLPLFWPPGREWNKQELQRELLPMFKNCHDEQGKLPHGIKSVEQLVESILEDSRKRNSFVDSSPAPKTSQTSGYQRSRSVRNFSSQSSLVLPHESPSNNNNNSNKTKYRPICASSTTTSSAGTANIAKLQPQQTLPVVLNIQHIQPVLALVQSKTTSEVSSAGGGSTCVLSVQSVQTPTSTKSPGAATIPESPVPSSVVVTSLESKSSTCSPETNKCEIATQTVPAQETDEGMIDKSPASMPHVFASSTPNSGFSPLSVAVETSPCFSQQGNFHNVNSQVLNSELPLRSFENSSADVNLQSLTVDSGVNFSRTEDVNSHPVVYTSFTPQFCENTCGTSNNNYARSRSEASDLGFSEITEFSPNVFYNQHSNKPTNPLLGSCQGIANYTQTQPDFSLSSDSGNPNYEVKTFHCNSFSSHGQISSIGTISSSSSASLRMESNAYYELNVSTQEHHQQSCAVVAEQVTEQPEMVAQVREDVELPNQISQHLNSFQNSSTETQQIDVPAHVVNENSPAKEVYSVVDLPDLSAMAGFNEQMTQLSSGNVQHDQLNQQSLFTLQQGSLDELTYITEYSPSWCYEEGGEKILIAGNWPQGTSGDLFQCHFGNKTSPAALILPGVLRCLSPGSNCGIVPLAISRNGHFITHSVPFEYRPKPTSRMDSDWFKVSANNTDWLALNDHEFRFRLLSRLNEMQSHLMSFIGNGMAPSGSQNSAAAVSNNVFGSSQDSTASSESVANFEVQFERQFSVILQLLAHLKETNSSHAMTELPRPPRGLTMLHLAAALGMPRLIDTMRSCLPQIGGLSDLNPATLDDQHCSALSWACARGNLECALILHNWCHEMLSARNRFDLTPLMIAKMRGHVLLVETLADKETGAERRHSSHNPNGRFKKRCPDSLTTPSRGPSIDPSVFHDESDEVSSCSEYDSEDICSLGSVPTMAESTSQATDPVGVGGGMEVDYSSPVGPSCSCPIHGNRDCSGRSGAGHQMSSSDIDDDASSPFITTSLQVYNLAEQIIRAIPERIKNSHGEESPEVRAAFDTSSSRPRMPNNYEGMTPWHGGGQASDVSGGGLFHGTPLGPFMNNGNNTRGERLPSFENSFTNWDCGRGGGHYNWCAGSDCSSFDLFSDEFDYNEFELGSDTGSDRRRVGTVNSDTHPQSQGGGVGCDSPMEDLAEFIQGRGNVEAELNSLTLSDSDQRTLYESAKIIQSAFRQYKQCRQKRQQEIEAAILIQSYFRKYRQYFSYKRMCRAARLIQKVFRRYKYNSYGPHTPSSSSHSRMPNIGKGTHPSSSGESVCSRAVGGGGSRRRSSSIISYLTKHDIDQAVLLVQRNYRRRAKRRRENDAALKIQRFLRQCRNKVQALRCDTTNPPSVMRYLISQ